MGNKGEHTIVEEKKNGGEKERMQAKGKKLEMRF